MQDQPSASLKQGTLLAALPCAAIRKACISACLNAMIEGHRFDYTDIYVRK